MIERTSMWVEIKVKSTRIALLLCISSTFRLHIFLKCCHGHSSLASYVFYRVSVLQKSIEISEIFSFAELWDIYRIIVLLHQASKKSIWFLFKLLVIHSDNTTFQINRKLSYLSSALRRKKNLEFISYIFLSTSECNKVVRDLWLVL